MRCPPIPIRPSYVVDNIGWWKSSCPDLVRASGEQSPGATRPPNLYVEVISWDKVLNDARMRNRIFFEHLGI